MTKEQAAVDTRDLDYQIGAMQAFKARRQIECRFRDTGGDVWKLVVDPKWNWDLVEYRIKPTPVLRPWTEDDVPLGAWMRVKDSNCGHRRVLICGTYDELTRSTWLSTSEHSTDGGKTWLPCGVVEEAK